MPKPLSGPVMPAASGKTDSLVILSHGYGSDGNDLIGLASYWQKILPNTGFVAPNAPEPCPGSPNGYQWFPISRLDPHEIARGVEAAAPVLADFIAGALRKFGVPPSRLVLAGFSQGTMMSLQVGLRLAVPPAAILGFSGMLAAPPPADISSPPPVMMVHGDADDMLPVAQMFQAVHLLGMAGISAQWHVSHGVGHGIDPEGLEIGGRFVRAALDGQLKGAGACALLT